eukprot:3918761-Amphidinium_carterae.1
MQCMTAWACNSTPHSARKRHDGAMATQKQQPSWLWPQHPVCRSRAHKSGSQAALYTEAASSSTSSDMLVVVAGWFTTTDKTFGL